MSAREAVIRVLESRKRPVGRDELLDRVTKLTGRSLKTTSLAVIISNLRSDGFNITRGPRFALVS